MIDKELIMKNTNEIPFPDSDIPSYTPKFEEELSSKQKFDKEICNMLHQYELFGK